MNYYFFPDIEGFNSSVTLINFPCLDTQKAIKDQQYMYATWSDGTQWHYKKLGEIQYNQAIEMKHSDLPHDIPRSPFLFFHFETLPPSSKELIVSNHMHVMPTWRGNIKIFSDHTSTSYEGDYQHEMVLYIKKGSLVSLSPMFQKSKETKNLFIFVNITQSPLKAQHEIHFFDPLRKKILYTTYVYNNTCNIVDVSFIDMPQDTPILAISTTIAGIPIYFSHTHDKKNLSFEHTHPPSSLVVFGNPLYFQRKMKDYWIKEFEEARKSA